MATLLELRRRVRSVKNIRQITSAMKMVAAAKLRRSQERMLNSRPYSDRMWEVLNELAQRTEVREHPLLKPRPEGSITAVIITADRGLCGAFNANITRYAQRALKVWQDRNVKLVTVGKIGERTFRHLGWPVQRTYPDVISNLDFADAAALAGYLTEKYVDGHTDAVYLIYNEFVTVFRQNLVAEPLLPIRGMNVAAATTGARETARSLAFEGGGGDETIATGGTATAVLEAADSKPVEMIDYLYEPGAAEVFDALLPRHVETQVYRALLESTAAEHAARMAAMDNATRNAEEVIENLTLTMNKIRQEEITTEILEVVGGAEALA